MAMLSEMGINVVESEEGEDASTEDGAATKDKAVRADNDHHDHRNPRDAGYTDDPVRMYLREMGSVELLSREGEIAIAKRIEAGREAMIGGLCESPLTFRRIVAWRDAQNERPILLRDIIDLDATYGGGPDAAKNGANGANGAAAPNGGGNGAANGRKARPTASALRKRRRRADAPKAPRCRRRRAAEKPRPRRRRGRRRPPPRARTTTTTTIRGQLHVAGGHGAGAAAGSARDLRPGRGDLQEAAPLQDQEKAHRHA